MEISNVKALPYFNTSAETTLQTDASKKGLGACLIKNGKVVMLPEHSQRLSRIIRTWNKRH